MAPAGGLETCLHLPFPFSLSPNPLLKPLKPFAEVLRGTGGHPRGLGQGRSGLCPPQKPAAVAWASAALPQTWLVKPARGGG